MRMHMRRETASDHAHRSMAGRALSCGHCRRVRAAHLDDPVGRFGDEIAVMADEEQRTVFLPAELDQQASSRMTISG